MRSAEHTTRPSLVNATTFFLLFGAHIALIWVLPYFPSQDGPSHMYNLVILRDLLHGGSVWGSDFTYHLRLVPNLAFYLTAYPLLTVFSPLIGERIFLSFYTVLLAGGVFFLLQTFKRPIFPYAYLALPTIFNFNVLMGFYSYVLTVPLFLFAFSIAWRLRRRSLPLRLTFMNVAGAALFYLHIIPFAFFVMSMAAMAFAGKGSLRAALKQTMLQLCGLLPVMLLSAAYFLSPQAGHRTNWAELFDIPGMIRLAAEMTAFSSVTLSRWQLLPASFFMLVVGVTAYSSFKEILGPARCSESEQERTLVVLLAMLIVVYLAAPFHFGGGSFFNQRFPWVLLLLLLPLLRVPPVLERYGSPVAAGLAIAFFAVNGPLLWQQSDRVAQFNAGLGRGPGQGNYVMAYRERPPSWTSVDPLLHVASYYGIIDRCVDIGNYEVDYDYFFIHIAPGRSPFPDRDTISYDPQKIDFGRYPDLSYILEWRPGSKAGNRLSPFYEAKWHGDKITVWKRVR